MPFKKWFTSVKKPTVIVQTKKMPSWDCCATTSTCWTVAHCCGKLFVLILLLANLVLTAMVLFQQRNVESMRVGGMANYSMLRQVFQSEWFQEQQKQQIQQAMQMYKIPVNGWDATNAVPAQVPVQ